LPQNARRRICWQTALPHPLALTASALSRLARLAQLCALACALLMTVGAHEAGAKTAVMAGPQRLEVDGGPDAFYYRPKGRGLKPVIVYLHGRGNNPEDDCRNWAKVATQFGWVLCPQGPEDRGGGSRAWDNNAVAGEEIVTKSLQALHTKFRGRVQTRGNVLIGFSEGAFIAMQLGIHQPKTWNRWLILAANDQYWLGDAATRLHDERRDIRKVYLLTGENDGVAESTTRVGELVKAQKIPVRVKIAPGMGHEVPGDRMITTYRRPLLWLTSTH
jgi:predicted esterase